MRTHALQQAALVWGVGELTECDVDYFLKYGEIGAASNAPMPHMPEVDLKIAEIYANGGKLVVI